MAVKTAIILMPQTSVKHFSETEKSFDEIFTIGCTGSCQYDNFRCSDENDIPFQLIGLPDNLSDAACRRSMHIRAYFMYMIRINAVFHCHVIHRS